MIDYALLNKRVDEGAECVHYIQHRSAQPSPAHPTPTPPPLAWHAATLSHPSCRLHHILPFSQVGNAAGTATCLIAGGGNEAPGSSAAAAPPPGAVPTFAVRGLDELREKLLATAPGATNTDDNASSSSTNGSLGLLGWSLSSESEDDEVAVGSAEGAAAGAALQRWWLDPTAPGAPAPGLDLVDALVDELHVLRCATTSFPRMGAAAGGLAACSAGGGDAVAHVCCGDGALTKVLASRGLRVLGVDADVTAATRRGLRAAAFQGPPLARGSLAGAAALLPRAADVVLLHETAAASVPQRFDVAAATAADALAEYKRLLRPGGALALEAPLGAAASAEGKDAISARLNAAGYDLLLCTRLQGDQLRIVATLRA